MTTEEKLKRMFGVETSERVIRHNKFIVGVLFFLSVSGIAVVVNAMIPEWCSLSSSTRIVLVVILSYILLWIIAGLIIKVWRYK